MQVVGGPSNYLREAVETERKSRPCMGRCVEWLNDTSTGSFIRGVSNGAVAVSMTMISGATLVAGVAGIVFGVICMCNLELAGGLFLTFLGLISLSAADSSERVANTFTRKATAAFMDMRRLSQEEKRCG